jgi:hypothetical protein
MQFHPILEEIAFSMELQRGVVKHHLLLMYLGMLEVLRVHLSQMLVVQALNLSVVVEEALVVSVLAHTTQETTLLEDQAGRD